MCGFLCCSFDASRSIKKQNKIQSDYSGRVAPGYVRSKIYRWIYIP